MSKSSIEWTDETWNPVSGCTRASAGCDNCYAVTMTKRLEAMGQEKYAGLVNVGKNHFNGKIKLHDDALTIPLIWKKPRKVFVNSMSDLFHPDVPFDFIDKVFAVMALTPQHTYQVLTKRPERMSEYLRIGNMPGRLARVVLGIDPCIGGTNWQDVYAWQCHYAQWCDAEGLTDTARWRGKWPLPNVWLGTSIESNDVADRISHLRRCPAAVWFLSCEPLLGDIDISPFLYNSGDLGEPAPLPYPKRHWVICGGESGAKARPMALGWAKDIVRQCQAASVPVFVKQLGANPTNREGEPCPHIKHHKGADMSEWPEELRIREYPEARP